MRLKNNPNKMNNKRNSGIKLKFKKILLKKSFILQTDARLSENQAFLINISDRARKLSI